MHYLGVPTCPYCKKRVNLIRTWSLKRQGEYLCPRCGGASNIYLSPLIYVLALVAVFSSGVLYFFHKYVLDDITLETGIYVFIPFAAFFLFSLFMVYLEKPVIKKVSRAEYDKKRRFRSSAEEASPPAKERPEYFDDDYTPRGSHRPGPAPQQEFSDSGVVNQQAFHRARQQAEMENTQKSQRIHIPAQTPPPQRPRPQQPPVQAPRTAAQQPRTAQPARPIIQQRPAGYGQVQQNRTSVQNRTQGTQSQQRMTFAQQGAAVRSAQAAQQRSGQGYSASQQHGARPVSGVQRPLNSQQPVAGRYDDSAYVQRRIREMERGTNEGTTNRR